jgi:hypothetical protein
MAKPLGPKSLLIRDAIRAHPDKGNKELAEMINASPARKEDKIEVKPGDIAQQKQAMKKSGDAPPAEKPAPAKRGRRGGARKRTTATPTPATAAAPSASPVDLIDKTLDLAAQAGGVAALKRLVDRLADMQRW